MKSISPSQIFWPLGLAAVLGGLSGVGQVWLALLVIGLVELYQLRQTGSSLEGLLVTSPRWLVGVSVVVLIALAPKVVTELFLGLAYGGWLLWLSWLSNRTLTQSEGLVIAAVTQFGALAAIFVAAALWHWPKWFSLQQTASANGPWPSWVLTAMVWLASYVVANFLLLQRQERARRVLAAAWALVAAECAWVFSAWLVNYLLFRGFVIIPQAAVVLTALGYCYGGIYIAHINNRLGRGRLLEYLMIGLALLLIVIAGTKWNGAI